MKNIWEVADIEVFPNLFTYTGYDIINNKWNVFTIHPEGDNDYDKLVNHLIKNKPIMIGYNIDGYDYPMLHHLINHRMEYSQMSPRMLTRCIYEKSQKVINSDFNTVADRNKHFMVIDLFTMWHYNNVAKLTS